MKIDSDAADLVIILGVITLGVGVLMVAGAGWFVVYVGIAVIIAGLIMAYQQARRSRSHPEE